MSGVEGDEATRAAQRAGGQQPATGHENRQGNGHSHGGTQREREERHSGNSLQQSLDGGENLGRREGRHAAVVQRTDAALAGTAALAAYCFVKVIGLVLLGLPRRTECAQASEVPVGMRASMVVLAAACVAGVIPARRAASVDPVRALRTE